MVSVAIHTIVLPAAFFLLKNNYNQNQDYYKMKPPEYPNIIKLLMTSARLLNDTQSYQVITISPFFLLFFFLFPIIYISFYCHIKKVMLHVINLFSLTAYFLFQKEQEDGKMNFVMLHSKENPEGHLYDSIAFTKQILEEKTKEFLELVLMDIIGLNNNDQTVLPKSTKQLYLSCMKVFHMFFNSTNLFDTKTQLLNDIKKAIYVPLHSQPYLPDLKLKLPPPSVAPKIKDMIIKISSRSDHFKIKSQIQVGIGFVPRPKALPTNPISVNPILLSKFS